MWDVIGVLIKWIIILLWRFFSGSHMNGRIYNDATWFQNASAHYRNRRPAYTWWRRKARAKRAGWRNAIFWPVILITWGFIWSTSSMLLFLGFLMPGIALIAFGRIRLALYLPIVAHNSDGSVTQNWVLKPKVRRRIATIMKPKDIRKRRGVALESELRPGVHLENDPDQYEVEVIEDDLKWQPPDDIKLLMAPKELRNA